MLQMSRAPAMARSGNNTARPLHFAVGQLVPSLLVYCFAPKSVTTKGWGPAEVQQHRHLSHSGDTFRLHSSCGAPSPTTPARR